MIQQSHSGHISGQNSNPKRYTHPKVHSSTIYNSQDIQANYTFIHRWVDEETWYVVHMCICVCVCVCVCIHNWISLSHKKKKNNATWSKRYYRTKQSKSERYGITWYPLRVKSKIRRKWTCLQNRKRLTDSEHRPVVAQGERGREEKACELGISRCELLHAGWMNIRSCCRAQGTMFSILWQTVMKKNMEKYINE